MKTPKLNPRPHAALVVAVMLFASCVDNGSKKEEPKEDKTSLLEGVWSYDKAGSDSKITIHEGIADFHSFSGDKWKIMADDGHIEKWDEYFSVSDYTGNGNFSCWYGDYPEFGSEWYEVVVNLSDDGRTLTVQADGGNETWYKQSSQPALWGRISFWTDRSMDPITITLFDGSYERYYNPVDSDGNIDASKQEEYYLAHRIGETTMQRYFPDGIPACGQSGTISWKVEYGTYKYIASNSRNTWEGTVSVNSGCVLEKI